jgi:hypothetical protein
MKKYKINKKNKNIIIELIEKLKENLNNNSGTK